MTGARLAGKVCIITGAGGSMGRAAARMFAAEGASVVGCDIKAEANEETARVVAAAGGEFAALHPVDLSSRDGSETLVEFTLKRHGRIDVLYNNGGAGAFSWFQEMTGDQWSFTLRHELDLIFFATQAAWPHLIAAGGGSVINVGSVSGKLAYRVLPGVAHSAAKGGVIAVTKHLAMEGAPHCIRVNSISPGLVLNETTRVLLEDETWRRVMLDKIMLGRPAEPEDIIPAAIYLASDESRWVTGADFAIDGGTTAW